MTPNLLLGIGIGFLATSLFFSLPLPEWVKFLMALGAQGGLLFGLLWLAIEKRARR